MVRHGAAVNWTELEEAVKKSPRSPFYGATNLEMYKNATKKKAEQGEKQKQLEQAEEKRREEGRGEENRRDDDDDDDQRKVKNPNKQCGQGGSMRPTPTPLATHTYHATGPSTVPP